MEITFTEQRDFIKLNLGPTLAKAGLGPDQLKLMIHDNQRQDILNCSRTVLSDPSSAKYVSGIAVHWYGNGEAPVTVLDEVAKEFPNYFILNSEASEMDLQRDHKDILPLGRWESGEAYANDIITVSNYILLIC